jgi:hypothetical protein
VADNDHVEKLWRGSIHRLRFDDRADADHGHHAPQLIDGTPQVPAAVSKIRPEGDDDGSRRSAAGAWRLADLCRPPAADR